MAPRRAPLARSFSQLSMISDRPPKQKPMMPRSSSHSVNPPSGSSSSAIEPLTAANAAKLRTWPTALTTRPVTRQASMKPSDHTEESRPTCAVEPPFSSSRMGSRTP